MIYKVGINPVVDIPDDVSASFGRGNIPVKGILNKTQFIATLVPVAGAHHRLHINGALRRTAGVGPGDRVEISVEYDPEPRVEPIPSTFALALDKNPQAKAVFDGFPPSHQREILQYLNYLKKPETLERRVRGLIEDLEKKAP